VDRAALRFLIESLNDDGYLEDSLASLAAAWPARATWSRSKSWCTASAVALRLLQSLEPVGVGARHLAECLTLQLKARLADEDGRCDRQPPRCASASNPWSCWPARHQAPDAAVRRHRGTHVRAAMA
jgi:hypothetical protein